MPLLNVHSLYGTRGKKIAGARYQTCKEPCTHFILSVRMGQEGALIHLRTSMMSRLLRTACVGGRETEGAFTTTLKARAQEHHYRVANLSI